MFLTHETPFRTSQRLDGEEDFEKPYRSDKDYLRVEVLLFSLRLMAAMPTG